MTTMPLPLRDYPKGLTVVPMHHAAAFTAALAAAAEFATENGADYDERVGAYLLRVLYQAHIKALDARLEATQAEASATAVKLERAHAEVARHVGDAQAAAARRAVQAERRDKALRELVRARDGDRCRYCGSDVDPGGRGAKSGVLDHVEPGKACGAANLVMSCGACHRRKSKLSPGQAGMTLLPVPESPRLAEPGPARKVTMETSTTVKTDGTEAAELETYERVPEIRLSVNYPNGQHTSVTWEDGVTEPTPDELVEMMRQLAPAHVPHFVTVELKPGSGEAMADAVREVLRQRFERHARTAEAVLNPDGVQPGDPEPGADGDAPAAESTQDSGASA